MLAFFNYSPLDTVIVFAGFIVFCVVVWKVLSRKQGS